MDTKKWLGCSLVLLLLIGCGGGGSDSGDTPSEPSAIIADLTSGSIAPATDIIKIEMTGDITVSNLIAGVGVNGSDDKLYLVGTKSSGNIDGIDSVIFESTVDDITYTADYEVDDLGLPKKLTGGDGSYVTYTNWTDSSVDITLFSKQGNVIESTITVQVDANEISRIKSLFNTMQTTYNFRVIDNPIVNTRSIDNPIINNSAQVYSWMGVVANVGGCVASAGIATGSWAATPFTVGVSAAIAIPATAAAYLSCGSFVVSTASALFDIELLDSFVAVFDSAACFILGPSSCAATVFDMAAAASDPESPVTTIYTPKNNAIFNTGEAINFIATFDTRYGDIVEAKWNFGDGDTYSNMNEKAAHSYDNNGVYIVSFTLTYDDGLQVTDQVIVEITGQPQSPSTVNVVEVLTDNSVGSGPLNDTGITTCADLSSNGLDCPVADFAGQDAEYGRDAQATAGTLTKVGAGSGGFDFTKLDSEGEPLAIQSGTWENTGDATNGTKWSCVKDNHTGLMWEVKTNDASDKGLRDASHTYTWFNTDANTNNGADGTANGGTCYDTDNCDTQKYVTQVNALASNSGLCGKTDWRMPSMSELRSIVSYGKTNPAIDDNYFPNTASTYYWSSSADAYGSSGAWIVGFGYGYGGSGGRSALRRVRLVRSGQ